MTDFVAAHRCFIEAGLRNDTEAREDPVQKREPKQERVNILDEDCKEVRTP